jgi:hypothetical protein
MRPEQDAAGWAGGASVGVHALRGLSREGARLELVGVVVAQPESERDEDAVVLVGLSSRGRTRKSRKG